jgi:hypothetical protein
MPTITRAYSILKYWTGGGDQTFDCGQRLIDAIRGCKGDDLLVHRFPGGRALKERTCFFGKLGGFWFAGGNDAELAPLDGSRLLLIPARRGRDADLFLRESLKETAAGANDHQACSLHEIHGLRV